MVIQVLAVEEVEKALFDDLGGEDDDILSQSDLIGQIKEHTGAEIKRERQYKLQKM